MTTCTCPEDQQKVPSMNRVVLFEPGAMRRDGPITTRDLSKVHIYDKTCPVHGYWEVDKEGNKLDVK